MGNKIGEIMKNRGMTSYRVAKDTGISDSTINAWINDPERSVNQKAQLKLADYFGVSVDYLMGREDTKKSPVIGQDDGRYKEMIRLLKQIPEDRLPEAMEILRVIVGRRNKKEQ